MRLRLGSVEHDLTTRTLVTGLLDGATDAGRFDGILRRAEMLVEEGADLLDVGGVKAGATVGEDEELERLVPLVAALRDRFEVPLAVDTWRPRVLAECCAAGAVVANDVGGFADPNYLAAAARAEATVIATHERLPPDTTDIVGEVCAFLSERVARAGAAGIGAERLIVDAGLDRGKSPSQSLTLLRESATLADLGVPLLLDASKGRFLGMLLGLEADERRVAGQAAQALAIARGCRLVRAHDVRGARRVAVVLEALLTARLGQVERLLTTGERRG